jgi:hypothetical protein
MTSIKIKVVHLKIVFYNSDYEGEDGQKLLETVWQKSEDDAKKSKRGGTRPKLTERDLLDGQKGIPALRERFDKLGFGPRDGPVVIFSSN